MKHLAIFLIVIASFPALLPAQRTLEEKALRSPVPAEPGLPYIQKDGREAVQSYKRYQGISRNLHLRVAAAQHPEISVLARDEEGKPVFLKTRPAAAKNLPENTSDAALFFLEDIADMIGVKQPVAEFIVTEAETDPLGHRMVRLRQQFEGVPLWGAEVVVRFHQNGQIIMAGRYASTPTNFNTRATISESEAIDAALEEAGKHTPVRWLRPIERKMLRYPEHKGELMIYRGAETGGQPRLVYFLDLRPNFMARWSVFVDARSGDIVTAYDHTCTIGPVQGRGTDLNNVSRNFSVFDAGGNRFYLMDADQPMYTGPSGQLPDLGDGLILTADMNNTTLRNPQFNDIVSSSANSWSAKAVSAHYNAIESYEYFRTTHSRNSINGSGGDIVSFINVADDDGGGLDNAFWNGQAIFYGGGRTLFKPLAGGLDVAAHEMSHGVIQETANLEYRNESGAMNEAFADIFGAMVDRNDWRIGEDVMRQTGRALRDMQNPHNGAPFGNFNAGWQPEKYSERYTGSQDNGGVHINSGIINRAYYLFATANGMTKDKAEKVFYRALTQYLTRSSNFTDLRLAVVQAAEDRHGANSPEVNAARSAFDQVEILDPNGGGGSNPAPTPPPGDLQPNPGQDFIVSTDINPGDVNTLYISNTAATQFAPIATREHKHKMSITDDGSLGVYVGTNGHIYLHNMDPNSPQSSQLSVNPVWENAVISKDGRRLAAVETSVDTSLYVFNLAANPVTGVRYYLYNPTYTQGVNFSGMLFVDAMEFDYTGEFLAFDAFNRIRNASGGADLTFWNIGFMNVWNNASNTFGDGTIELLVGQLDPGDNIAEPAFAKNSPYIMAFDYFTQNPNPGDDPYYLLGINLETDTAGIIWNQNRLHVPSYSKLDDKILFNAEDNNGDDVVAVADINPDKVSYRGNARALIPNAQWGVWYSTGLRVTNPVSVEPELSQIPFHLYPNPAREAVTVQFSLESADKAHISLLDLTGREVRQLAPRPYTAGEQAVRLSLTDLPSGSYLLRLQTGSTLLTRKLVVW